MKIPPLFCLIAFFLFPALAQNERYLKPIDEARQDASFFAFRTKLIEAVKKRDTKYLLGVVDPRIRNTFGEDDGIRYFKKTWKIESPKSEFWDKFTPVIGNGGVFSSVGRTKLFSAPYTYTSFPEDLDNVEYAAIFGGEVNLRERPDVKSKALGLLSHNIVKVDYQNSVPLSEKEKYRYSWLRVETLGGRRGFVKAEYVRGPLDYRAVFEKKNGRWKMTAFIAGD
jgi:hypothetical protein